MPNNRTLGGAVIAAGAACAAYGGYNPESAETFNALAILLVCAGVFIWRKKPEDSSRD